MTIKNFVSKVGHNIAKNSPAILIGAGVVGLGATAVLAYKARNKVEAVVEDVERQRDLGKEVDTVKVVKDMTQALYLPVVVGLASTTAIIFAHKIQTKRIMTLAGALVAQQARNAYFENKYRAVHGEEAYAQFVTPTERETTETVDSKGKVKTTVKEVKKETDQTIGEWFNKSTEYASDDHTYNIAVIDSVTDRMQTILFQRGTLTLNEVREALGFERSRNGALLGWSSADSFDIYKTVTNLEEDGVMKDDIWVTWSTPRYIYNDVEFNGRYSIY